MGITFGPTTFNREGIKMYFPLLKERRKKRGLYFLLPGGLTSQFNFTALQSTLTGQDATLSEYWNLTRTLTLEPWNAPLKVIFLIIFSVTTFAVAI